jgi:hypothetical protein
LASGFLGCLPSEVCTFSPPLNAPFPPTPPPSPFLQCTHLSPHQVRAPEDAYGDDVFCNNACSTACYLQSLLPDLTEKEYLSRYARARRITGALPVFVTGGPDLRLEFDPEDAASTLHAATAELDKARGLTVSNDQAYRFALRPSPRFSALVAAAFASTDAVINASLPYACVQVRSSDVAEDGRSSYDAKRYLHDLRLVLDGTTHINQV